MKYTLRRGFINFFLTVAAALTMFAAKVAHGDDYTVHWICNLPAPAPIGCSDLIRSLEQAWPTLNLEGTLASAKVRIEITRRNEAGRRIYVIRANELNHGVFDELPNVLVERVVTDGTQQNIEINLLTAYLQQIISVFFQPEGLSQEQNGHFVSVYRLPEPQLGRRTASNTHWYFSPGLSISGGGGGQGLNMSGGVSATTNYSTVRWRFRESASLNYQHLRFVSGGEVTDASLFTFNGNLLLVRGLSPHINVALTAAYTQDHSMNYAHNVSGQAAVEWILVPFQQTMTHNFALRYSAGTLWNQYVSRTTLNQESDLFVQNTASALAFLHFAVADLNASVGVTTNLPRFDFIQLNFSAGVTLRPTPRVGISLQGNVGYYPERYNAWVTAPSDELSILNSLNGGFSELVYGFSVNLNYVFGAENIFRSDRRMTGFQ